MGCGNGQGCGSRAGDMPEAAWRMLQDGFAAARVQAAGERAQRLSLLVRIPTAPTGRAAAARQAWRLFGGVGEGARTRTYCVRLPRFRGMTVTFSSTRAIGDVYPPVEARSGFPAKWSVARNVREPTIPSKGSSGSDSMPNNWTHTLGLQGAEQPEDFPIPDEVACEPLRSCSAPAFNRKPASHTDACSSDSGGESAHVVGCSTSIEGILRDAWCMLKENFDLVTFANCLYGSDTEDSDDIEDILSRNWPWRVDLNCGRTWVPDPDFEDLSVEEVVAWADVGGASVFGGDIDFNTDYRGQDWEAIIDCGTDADRLCLTIALAGAMLHEMLHLIGREHTVVPNVTEPSVRCALERIYPVETAFVCLCLMRFPAAMGGNCCRKVYGVFLGQDSTGETLRSSQVDFGDLFGSIASNMPYSCVDCAASAGNTGVRTDWTLFPAERESPPVVDLTVLPSP